jgi:hypothetical protein
MVMVTLAFMELDIALGYEKFQCYHYSYSKKIVQSNYQLVVLNAVALEGPLAAS